MKKCSKDAPTTIMDLPDDCMYSIFSGLDSFHDRRSFGLTCHRWLHIQNSSRRSLQFHCLFGNLKRLSLSRTSSSINAFHLDRLLNRFQHLETLFLSGCTELPDIGLNALQYHGSKLLTLNFDCCFKITDDGLSMVAAGCSSLEHISLERCNITDVGIEALAESCSALKNVNVSYCTLVTDRGIRTLMQRCVQMRAVKMSKCGNITGVGFEGCSQNLYYLEADCCKLSPEGIAGIASGGGLEFFSVSVLLRSMRSDSLAVIGSASRLRVLNLRQCRFVGDESIVEIAKGCPLLQELNLASCNEITVQGWASIGLYCCNLETLNVYNCQKLCDEGLKALRNGCKKLKLLYITSCHRVTSVAIEMFKILRGKVVISETEDYSPVPIEFWPIFGSPNPRPQYMDFSLMNALPEYMDYDLMEEL